MRRAWHLSCSALVVVGLCGPAFAGPTVTSVPDLATIIQAGEIGRPEENIFERIHDAYERQKSSLLDDTHTPGDSYWSTHERPEMTNEEQDHADEHGGMPPPSYYEHLDPGDPVENPDGLPTQLPEKEGPPPEPTPEDPVDDTTGNDSHVHEHDWGMDGGKDWAGGDDAGDAGSIATNSKTLRWPLLRKNQKPPEYVIRALAELELVHSEKSPSR